MTETRNPNEPATAPDSDARRRRTPLRNTADDLYPGLANRSSTHVRMRLLAGTPALRRLDDLVDEEVRDRKTGRRMMTKMAELGRVFPQEFWASDVGVAWLRRPAGRRRDRTD